MIQFNKDQLSQRQKLLLEIIEKVPKAGNKILLHELQKALGDISRITVIREINVLLKQKIIKRHGRGRGIWYETKIPSPSKSLDPATYFQIDPDERIIKTEKIDFTNITPLENLFSKKELEKFQQLTAEYQKRAKKYHNPEMQTLLQKELERITIEFSWKSSQIEGNTYSLLDTERLIKQHQEAAGKTHDEATMILNHKKALEYIWKYPNHFEKISPQKIEEIHTLIAGNLDISMGFRKRPVGIIGTIYRPHDNQFQIREAIEDLCKLLNAIKNPFEKATIAIAGLSYIQPFEDGNKRTSRVLGNAILLANTCCPLSYRSIDEIEYKKAIILFYEQHSFEYFKKLFIDQYEFAVENYFL